jgi:hypothetical protein
MSSRRSIESTDQRRTALFRRAASVLESQPPIAAPSFKFNATLASARCI